jgi:hypothetical protein
VHVFFFSNSLIYAHLLLLPFFFIFEISGQIDFSSNVFFTIFIGNTNCFFFVRRMLLPYLLFLTIALFLAFIFNQSQVFVRFCVDVFVMLKCFFFVVYLEYLTLHTYSQMMFCSLYMLTVSIE